jgi:hypothetical protein
VTRGFKARGGHFSDREAVPSRHSSQFFFRERALFLGDRSSGLNGPRFTGKPAFDH